MVANLSDQVNELFDKELADKGFVLESQSEIGSSVSAVLRNKAIQAILISLAGVIVYLAFRFDISFGLAAAAATLPRWSSTTPIQISTLVFTRLTWR